MSPSRAVILVLCSSLAACTTGMSTRDGSGGDLDGGGPGRDGGVFDPFDPANACGLSTIPTERVPGQLLIVFDRSGSMDDPANGDTGPSKWDLAVPAINNVLGSIPDELSAGLLLFPEGSSTCAVPAPQVAVAPLSTSRAQIMTALDTATPAGGGTPMYAAMRAGYRYLDTLTGPGQRGLVVVTDGQNTCDRDERDAVMAEVATELANNNYLTFAVGLDESNNDLSTVAYNGGTPRNATCLPECTSDSCSSDADCAGGTCRIIEPTFGIGLCACASDADCVAPQTCEDPCPPFFPNCGFPPQCSGDANCCHYNAAGGSFQSDFEDALDGIARRFLESCVFEVPRGADPSLFSPGLVNVGVTFDGEEREVLRRGDDSSVSSWQYADPENNTLIIQGPICDRLLMSAGVVEIVIGCPTILI